MKPKTETLNTIPDKKEGLSRLWAATFHSMHGIKQTFRSEEAFRFETYLFVIFVPIGLYVGDGAIEKTLLVGAIVMVLIVELFNTAIEVVVDRIGLEYHDLSRDAKDIGSACVLISLCLLVFTWVMLAFP